MLAVVGRLWPVRRLLRVTGCWIGRLEMLVGRAGRFLLTGGQLVGLRFEEWLLLSKAPAGGGLAVSPTTN